MNRENDRAARNTPDGSGELDPYEINFLPEFREGRGPRKPFVNSYGVVIGDHDYESPQSPLENWSTDTDPNVMAGEEWVHPYKDIGFHSSENRDYFEKGIPPRGGMFMHPDKNTAYELEEGRHLEGDGKSPSAGESNPF
jgi:hypothetical protein